MKKLLIISIAIIAVLAIAATTYLFCQPSPKLSETTELPELPDGIDVSHHQGQINWSKVPKVQFVYIKATEGATYLDPMYKQNIKGARKNGQKVGSYHYFRTTSSVNEQFANFKKHIVKSEQDLIPMVDVEECKNWTKSQFQDSLTKFCNLIKQHYGKLPMIYSVNSFYNGYCAPKFNNHYLMIGKFSNKRPIIFGLGHYTIWQYTEHATLTGISKEVDFDIFHSDNSIKDILLP